MLFPEKYKSEIIASAYRVSTRLLGGEDVGNIVQSLYNTGWYYDEVNKIMLVARLIAKRGAAA